MDEIIKQLVEKLNIDEAVAKQAIEVVLGALKDKLPAPIAEQLEGIIDGKGFDASQLGDLLGGEKGGLGGILGSLFGGGKN
jgi:hypothetical protein